MVYRPKLYLKHPFEKQYSVVDNSSLITSLVTGFGLALPFGYFAERFLKAPALIGYILAGVLVSVLPGLPEVDTGMLSQLAEIGVMLLMFGVGLHFSVRDLVAVKGVALPGAALNMLLIASSGALLSHFVWGQPWGAAVLFGFTISCASTVVVMKALEVRKLSAQMNGRVAIGWLVMEDLVSVVLLVCLPPFAAAVTGGADVQVSAVLLKIARTLAWAAVFVVIMLVVGRRVLPWLLREVAFTGSRELFTLTVLGCAIVIAYGAGAIFDVSFALGAFFAGMVMQESRYAHRAAQNSLPLQDAFSVLFFVSVGLMLDWHVFLERPWEILCAVGIICIGKFLFSSTIVVLLGWPLSSALCVAACIGQVGEFSFILAGQGIALKLVDSTMMSLIVAASIVTIAINPALFWMAPRLSRFLTSRSATMRSVALRETPGEALPNNTPQGLTDGQAIVVGCASTSKILLNELERSARRTIVICGATDPLDAIEALRARGFGVIVGDPTDSAVLIAAHAARAGVLVVPASPVAEAARILAAARRVNPVLPVVIRVSHTEEMALFDKSDKNLSLVCEPLITSMSITAMAMERIVKPEATEDEAQTRLQSVRDMLDAEYRRNVAAVRGDMASPEEKAEAERDASLEAAARVAHAANKSAEVENTPNEIDGARQFGQRTARWLRRTFWRNGASGDVKKALGTQETRDVATSTEASERLEKAEVSEDAARREGALASHNSAPTVDAPKAIAEKPQESDKI